MENANLISWCLRSAWGKYLEHIWIVSLAMLLYKILTLATTLILIDNLGSVYAYAYIILAASVLKVGMNFLFIKISRGDSADLMDIFSGFFIYKKAVSVSLLYAFMLLGGGLMLVIPAFFIASVFCFAEYIIIDNRKSSIKGSFLLSARITEGRRLQIFNLLIFFIIAHLAAPNILEMKNETIKLNLSFWPIFANALIIFVFSPWLSLAIAKAYNICVHYPVRRESPVFPQ